MKTFYVTFGMGTVMRGYYAAFEAYSTDIVRAYCNKHYRGIWASVYDSRPAQGKLLQKHPEQLFYAQASHV